jgi:hypothetical protein
MGWQPGNRDETGDEPGRLPGVPGISDASPTPGGTEAGGRVGTARDPWLDGFEEGGAWDTCPPGPVLSAVLARVAGPQWRCPEATDDELIGILRGLAATESWAAAGRLGVIRELIRRDALPRAARRPAG